MYSYPYYDFADIKNRLKYGDHPRRQTIKMEEVQKTKLDWAHHIYKDRFVDAGDFTFVFVGNFEPENIKPLLSSYLGNLPTTERKENWRNTHSGLLDGQLATVVYKGEAQKSLVEIIYHGDLKEKDSRLEFSLLTSLLRDRLRDQLREEKGGVYSVNVRPAAPRVPEATYRITISFNCSPEDTKALIDLIQEEIEKLKNQSVEAEELATIKEKHVQSRTVNLKENQFWLSQLVARYKYELPLENILLGELRQQLDKIRAEDLQKAARRYLSREDNYIELVLYPEKFNKQ